jgi:hypothetical protein
MTDDPENSGPTFKIVSRITELLEPLSEADRKHVLRTVGTWFRINAAASDTKSDLYPLPGISAGKSTYGADEEKFSDRPLVSAKDFVFEKDPLTEVERLACLAYYLKHYQDTPQFKTLDLSRLNTEAAQRKLSNPALTAGNAVRDGFFVQAPKAGCRQLSAMGERFVQLLPNREAALQVKKRMGSRRGTRSGSARGGKERVVKKA